ncbi:hypothetical protein RJ640_021147 [Escallonia rubra]|uniref:Uncharacterized protein n=1 Tax=Escallonia rubra TaxID=112253 RepID=A0AA88RHN6_9ASTE|nr:hypothetical protein RJ640_021147 [Escallonia rubra]
MDTMIGKMELRCISMALSDFYTSHGHYKTRLVPNSRNSNGSMVGAAAADWLALPLHRLPHPRCMQNQWQVKIKLAAATDEVEENVVATEVAIEVDVVHAVYAVDEDVVDNLLIEVKQATAIKHIVVVEDLEAEEEAEFNNEVINPS